VLSKLWFAQYAFGPLVEYDEFLYWQFAQSLVENFSYNMNQYPLLYPLALTPAYFFGDYFYEATKVLNIIYSSAILFPTWLIARLFLDKKTGFCCVLITALLPYHIAFTGMIMSENLYYFLLLTAIYAVLKTPTKNPYLWTVFTGVMLGALHLTRHMSLAITPILMLAWFLKPIASEQKIFSKEKLKHLAVLLLALLIAYSPWLIMRLQYTSVFKSVGGNFLDREITTPVNAQLRWLAVTACYTVLLIAPMLGITLMGYFQKLKEKWNSQSNRFALLVALLTGALIFAVARHHWYAHEDNGMMDRFVGRYLTYLSVPYIILTFVFIKRFQEKFVKSSHVILCTIFSMIAVVISYKLLIWQGFFQMQPWFLMDQIAQDVYTYMLMPVSFLWAILDIIILTSIALIVAKKYTHYVMCIALVIVYSWMNLAYLKPTMIAREEALHARTFAKIIKQYKLEGEPLTLYPHVSQKDPKKIITGIDFWGVNNTHISMADPLNEETAMNADFGLWTTSAKINATPLMEYIAVGKRYYMYEVPVSQ
jgi:hypothetical protein